MKRAPNSVSHRVLIDTILYNIGKDEEDKIPLPLGPATAAEKRKDAWILKKSDEARLFFNSLSLELKEQVWERRRRLGEEHKKIFTRRALVRDFMSQCSIYYDMTKTYIDNCHIITTLMLIDICKFKEHTKNV